MDNEKMLDLMSSAIAMARAIADGTEEERACFPPEFVAKADEVAAAWGRWFQSQQEAS